MRNDATEAALGLLGLTGSISFSTTPTIPLKRKPSTTTSFSLPPPTPTDEIDVGVDPDNSDSINCICGFTYDDGFSIACDDCSRWVHAACFDIVEGEVPEEWRCWVCQPRKVDRDRAVKLQRARQRQLQELEAQRNLNNRRRVSSPGTDRKRRASAAAIDGNSTSNGSTSAKRKRRYSVNIQQHQQHQHQHQQQYSHPQQPSVEDEHVDIEEPAAAAHTYIHLDKDLVPHHHTRDKLKRLARHWRGVTALDSPVDSLSTPVLLTPDVFQELSPTSLHPLPRSAYSHPTLSSNTNPYVRPQSYAVHTTQPIPSSGLIAPFTSTIIPSTVYLADPLNSYAHLGMPKPFVHLIGPPLDVALDARLAGNGARFVRSGCRPNAVLRPVLCRPPQESPSDSSDDSLAFGVFALRDLKAHEEVVLGWEWDDGSVIHHLPALIESPHLYAPSHVEHFRHQMTSMLHALTSAFTTCACGAKAQDCALTRLAEFVDGVIPPTPSPSPPSQFSEDRSYRIGHVTKDKDAETSLRSRSSTVDLGPLVGSERGFRTRERVPMSGGMSGVEMVTDGRSGPSGWGNLQSPEAGPSKLSPRMEHKASPVGKGYDRKGKGRATEDAEDVQRPAGNRRSRRRASSSQSQSSASCRSRSPTRADSTVPEKEEQLPPKLRKRWIQKSSNVLREANGNYAPPRSPDTDWRAPVRPPDRAESEEQMDVDQTMDDATIMPPPPLPPTLDPSSTIPPSLSTPMSLEVTSPTTSFANLSLLSPLVNGPSPHFPGSFRSASSASSSVHTSSGLSPVFSPAVVQPKLSVLITDPAPHDDPSILGSPFSRRELVPHLQDVVAQAYPVENAQGSDPHELFNDQLVTEPSAMVVDKKESSHVSDVGSSEDTHPHISVQRPVSPQSDVTISKEDVPPETPTPSPSPHDFVSPEQETPVPQSTDVVMDVEEPSSAASAASAVGVVDVVHTVADAEDDRVKIADEIHSTPTAEEAPCLPAAPHKVKMSLRDFAMRKKKQREEEQEKTHTSPLTSAVPLAEQPNDVEASVPELIPDVQQATLPEEAQAPAEQHASSPDIPQITGIVSTDHNASADVVTDPRCHKTRALSPRNLVESEIQPSESTAHDVSLQAKVELIEAPLPSILPLSVHDLPQARSPRPRSPSSTPTPPSSRNKKENEPAIGPRCALAPPQLLSSLSRQISQEDGEIFSPPAPKPLPLAPRAHSPPTHPRGFHSHMGSASPSRPPPRRPLQPAPYRPQLQNMPINSRPLPSGPRALRGANASTHYPLPSTTGRPVGGPHLAPRAPSADRDRDRLDWERDRSRVGPWNRGRNNWR